MVALLHDLPKKGETGPVPGDGRVVLSFHGRTLLVLR
jgi:hypothetical protein